MMSDDFHEASEPEVLKLSLRADEDSSAFVPDSWRRFERRKAKKTCNK